MDIKVWVVIKRRCSKWKNHKKKKISIKKLITIVLILIGIKACFFSPVKIDKVPHIKVRQTIKEKSYNKSSVVIFEWKTVKLEESGNSASWKETGKMRDKNKNGVEVINEYEAIIDCYNISEYTKLNVWQVRITKLN